MDFEGIHVHGIGANPITLWDGNAIRRLSSADTENMKSILDVFGKRSAKAQGLGAPITDIYRLRSTDQRLYLYATRHSGGTVVMGGLKVGSKKLFVRTDDGQLQEIDPTCVLDFYVDESYQRRGIGKELFEHFLASEGLVPGQVAYDRPSPKLLSFLRKHYGLAEYVPQNNNFVLYNQYWQLVPPKPQRNRRHLGSATAHPPSSSRPAASAGAMFRTQPVMSVTPPMTNAGGMGMHPSSGPTSPTSPSMQGHTMVPGGHDSASPGSYGAAPLYGGMRTNFSVPYNSSPTQSGPSPGQYRPDIPSSSGGGAHSVAAAAQLPAQYASGPSFGQRWMQNNSGGSPLPTPPPPMAPPSQYQSMSAGPRPGAPWEHSPHQMQQQQQQQQQGTGMSSFRKPLDSLDNFREEAAQRAYAASHSSNNGIPGPVPGTSVHTPAGPAYVYSPSMAPGIMMPGLGPSPPPHSQQHQPHAGAPNPPGSSSRTYVRPPWGTDEQLESSPGPPPSLRAQAGAPGSAGKPGAAMHMMGQFSNMTLATQGRSPGDPYGQHQQQGQGQQHAGAANARSAALAARAGSGAASCLVMS